MSTGSTVAEMGMLTSEMDTMTMASAQMQVQQSMCAAVASIAKGGASNVKDAARSQ